jgi:glycosyltransferase involved in cell wall biosynthesis
LMRAAYDQMPASKFAVVMNGFDGLEWQEFIESIPPGDTGVGHAADAPRKFRVTYAGNLYMKRNPAPLFRALRALIDSGEIGRDEASVELIGSCESSEGRGMGDIISEVGIEGCVEMRGRLSHSETLRRLLQSDLLLLLSEKQLIEIPGKTFEYLKTRRPILALTYEGAVATLLRRTGGAWVVSPDDQQGVINAVRECYRLWKCGLPGPAPDPLIVESFDRRRTTARIAELLDFLTL